MRWARQAAVAALGLIPLVAAIKYTPSLVSYNINTNQTATLVTDYSTTRANTTYTPSPENWRNLPVYTVLLDKFADGDPSNNDYFQTMFENDWRETQFRYGGDLAGLVAHLDYLQGMGIGLIFIAGTPFVNMPWEADSQSASSYF
jgi:alpha-1,3-glucan synthase